MVSNAIIESKGFYAELSHARTIDELGELLKKVKCLNDMKRHYAELKERSKEILKMQIEVICRMYSHEDFVKGEHLDILETETAEYFSKLTNIEIDELIKAHRANTPNALFNKIHADKSKKEFIADVMHLRNKIKSELSEYSEVRAVAIEELKEEIKEEVEGEVKNEIRKQITEQVVGTILRRDGSNADDIHVPDDFKQAIIDNVIEAVEKRKTARTILDKAKVDFTLFVQAAYREVDNSINKSGHVCVDEALKKAAKGVHMFGLFEDESNLSFFKDSVRNYIRRKYDVVRVLGGNKAGNYILLNYATETQIKNDLHERVKGTAHDLRMIESRLRRATDPSLLWPNTPESEVIAAARRIAQMEKTKTVASEEFLNDINGA